MPLQALVALALGGQGGGGSTLAAMH